MRHTRSVATLVVALPVVIVGWRAGAQPPAGWDTNYVQAHYTKYEHTIPMRDGVKLFTAVYVPKDKSRTYPIILRRTPYSSAPYGLDQFPERPDRQRRRYFQEGYIVAFQDVRGCWMSEGEFADVRPYVTAKKGPKDIDETTDSFDTIDWLVKNVPGNNGRVGVSGVSYPGFYSSMTAIDAHPALKAVSPQAPVSKWMGGDDFFHNGALLLSHAFDFYVNFGQPRAQPTTEQRPRFDHLTPDGYKFFLNLGPLSNANANYMKDRVAFWNELMRHGTWDAFWAARDVLPHLRNVKPATMVVGGWFDTENLYGALHTYAAIEQNNPGNHNMLVMGPWSHGQWGGDEGRRLGEIDFGSNTSEFYTEHVELPFFDYYLRDRPKPDLPEAMVFETGANQWRRLDAWPPRDAAPRELRLMADGRLAVGTTTGPGLAAPSPTTATSSEFVSDPSKPVPYTAATRHWYDGGFMVEDQRFAARRPDVAVYESEPLAEDLRVAGPMTATLYVSTTGTDADWVVKLIDVFPDDTKDPEPNPRQVRLGGYQMLVRGDVIRGKFRNGLDTPEPFVPGTVTKVPFELQDVFHRFRKGHRVMVQVQSTWFPMIDRNPQIFVDVYRARADDFKRATHRVYSSAEYPSALKVLVIP